MAANDFGATLGMFFVDEFRIIVTKYIPAR